jgi:hypothetical protein
MRASIVTSLCAANVLAMGVVALGQGAGQKPPAVGASTNQQITVTGCVQREADYRKAHEAGRAGVAGTGIGADNEFVLTDASAAAGAAVPTGTSGSSMAYELTGSNEGMASKFVGRRVEISGSLKAAETGAGGAPTGGATAGRPPSGVDVVSKDLKLRELEVSSVKEATGSCPTK